MRSIIDCEIDTGLAVKTAVYLGGMHHGIAIPHGKTDTVSSLVAVIGVKREGIEFDALDKGVSTIFVMTVSPANRAGPHIQFLAEISRLLNDEAVRKKIVGAQSSEEIYDIVIGH